jgi:hypothetical protein
MNQVGVFIAVLLELGISGQRSCLRPEDMVYPLAKIDNPRYFAYIVRNGA